MTFLVNSGRFRNWWQALQTRVLLPGTSPQNTSPLLIVSVAALRVSAHFWGSSDLGGRDIAPRTLYVLVSTVPVFALIYLANEIRVKHNWQRISVGLASYIAGGALGGWSLFLMLDARYNLGPSGLPLRIWVGVTTVTGTVFLLTLATATYRSHRNYLIGLTAETHGLTEALAKLEAENVIMTDSDVTNILLEVNRDLALIEMQPVPDQITALEAMVREKIRPFSRNLSRQVTAWRPTDEVVDRPRFFETWTQLDIFTHVPRWWNGPIIAIEGLPSAVYFFGWWRAVLGIGAGSLTLAILFWFQRKWLARRISNLTSPIREALLVGIFAADGFAAGCASTLGLLGTNNPQMYLWGAVFMTIFYGCAATLVSIYVQDTKLRVSKLEEVRDQLVWTIARVGMVSWFRRGVVSRLLHGPIQNSIHAALVRLRDRDSAQIMESALTDLRHRFSESSLVVLSGQPVETDFSIRLRQVCELWDGIADIEVVMPDSVVAELNNDEVAGGIVLDICSEMVSNAIRHGSATRLELALNLGPKKLLIQMTDNGAAKTQPKDISRLGVGTQLLDACSIFWKHTESDGLNKLYAAVPVVA